MYTNVFLFFGFLPAPYSLALSIDTLHSLLRNSFQAYCLPGGFQTFVLHGLFPDIVMGSSSNQK